MKPMRMTGRPARSVGIVILIVAGAAFALASWRFRQSGRLRPERRDVAMAEGEGLPDTADVSQRRIIRSLREGVRDADGLAGLTIDYPFDGSVFPPEIIAPTFLWHDTSQADRWLVDVALPTGPSRLDLLVPGAPPAEGPIDQRCISENNEVYRGTPYQQSARSWKPDPEVWTAIKRRSVDGPASLTFYGYRGDEGGRLLSRGRVTISTSADPVGAPIFYRDVPLMPSRTQEGVIKPLDKGALPLIIWRLRDIALPESRAMLTDMPTCANCHSFSNDGKTMGMDIDGPQGDRGAYAIAPIAKQVSIDYEQVMTWNAFKGKPKDFMTIGFLSRVSPDGLHVVSTVNEAIYVMNFRNYKFTQVFYPTRGILAVYSRSTGAIEALPGADDPDYVHCDPIWTPDGRTIVFARARAREPYIKGRPDATYAGDPNETPIQYDLYRIPFNDGRGGRAEPIAGASDNGMSNTFPKISPDGRYVVFTQCRNGQLMRPDGRLFIVPIEGGAPRLLSCNLPLMNSWHSFSPSGRWLVFSSKSNTPYTQMFLTHIDEQGRDTPAVLVENSTAANRAVNIPEFVNTSYDRFRSIAVPAVDHARHFNRGTELALKNRHAEAIAEFQTALASKPNDWKTSEWKIHENLSKSLLALGRKASALREIQASLRLNPNNEEMEANLATLLFQEGDIEQGRRHIDLAIALAPGNPKLWYNRATMRLEQGQRAAALTDYGEAIRLDPRYAEAYLGRGTALKDGGDPRPALADFDTTIRLDPKLPMAWYSRALARLQTGDRPGALRDLTKTLEVAPRNWPRWAEVEELRRQLRATTGSD